LGRAEFGKENRAKATNEIKFASAAQNVQCRLNSTKKLMLYYTLVFLLIAIIAGALGFWGIAGLAGTIAKVLFVVFLVLFILSLIKSRK
jgi:uncharacterized membrane protein YtjA (UPF0391 family)